MIDLEALREVFRDHRLHIAIAKIKQISVAQDRSVVRVLVSVFPEQREIVAKMSWEAVGPESGFFQMPVINDLVLVGMVDGDEESAFVLKRLTSKEDKVPLRAVDGDLVAKALTGKRVWVTSSDKVYLSRGDAEPTENLVLGKVFQTFMSTFLEKYIAHMHIGNLGYYTAPPDNASDVTSLKADPIDNDGVLSDLSFTEK